VANAQNAPASSEFTASDRRVGEFFGFVLLIWQQDSDIKFEFGNINADVDRIHHGTP
jgi:hypothetical protein